MLGIWKDYQELEDSLSMPELTAILVAKYENDRQDKKFLAALQGVDLDKESGSSSGGQKQWEDMKARVFSGGRSDNSDDITSLQGPNASKAGFGIGMGLEYADLKSESAPKNPLG
jgi:hypothetical protein